MASDSFSSGYQVAQSNSLNEPRKGLKEGVFGTNLDADTPHQIIDIRRGRADTSLANEIYWGLRPDVGGEKTLPTLLLYDENGLKLFEEITYLEEYYLTNAEIELLESHAEAIARIIKPDSVLLELGSG